MNRIPYTYDGEYILYPLSDEDRDNYVALHRQINGDSTLFLNEAVKDIMWEGALQVKSTKTYTIYKINGNYCGNVELQKYMSNTPEIGVELLENKRNQGIAAKAVKLLVQKFCEERKVEYFLIRIMSNNLHSKHVFEKMGAVLIEEEESIFVSIMDKFKNHADEKHNDELLEIVQNCMKEDDGIHVLKYKLSPEVFNK